MRYLLDTDWVIQSLAGHKEAALLQKFAPSGICLSIITVGELYEVAFNSTNPQAHLSAIRQFLAPFRVLSLNDPVMERFAEIRAFLRRRGNLIADFDLLLGATALHYNLTVLTNNVRDLKRIPDLRIYQAS
jgi:predicted nucleic acid-binding protein